MVIRDRPQSRLNKATLDNKENVPQRKFENWAYVASSKATLTSRPRGLVKPLQEVRQASVTSSAQGTRNINRIQEVNPENIPTAQGSQAQLQLKTNPAKRSNLSVGLTKALQEPNQAPRAIDQQIIRNSVRTPEPNALRIPTSHNNLAQSRLAAISAKRPNIPVELTKASHGVRQALMPTNSQSAHSSIRAQGVIPLKIIPSAHDGQVQSRLPTIPARQPNIQVELAKPLQKTSQASIASNQQVARDSIQIQEVNLLKPTTSHNRLTQSRLSTIPTKQLSIPVELTRPSPHEVKQALISSNSQSAYNSIQTQDTNLLRIPAAHVIQPRLSLVPAKRLRPLEEAKLASAAPITRDVHNGDQFQDVKRVKTLTANGSQAQIQPSAPPAKQPYTSVQKTLTHQGTLTGEHSNTSGYKPERSSGAIATITNTLITSTATKACTGATKTSRTFAFQVSESNNAYSTTPKRDLQAIASLSSSMVDLESQEEDVRLSTKHPQIDDSIDSENSRKATVDKIAGPDTVAVSTTSQPEICIEHERARPEKSRSILLQPDISYLDSRENVWNIRQQCVDLMVTVTVACGSTGETLHLGVHLFDRVMSKGFIFSKKGILLAMTCLLIAWKFEERYPWSLIHYLAEYVDDLDPQDHSSVSVLRAVEIEALKILEFKIGWPGPLPFLRRCSRADYEDPFARNIAKYILDQILIHPHFLVYKPSLLAAAAISLGRSLLGREEWTEDMTIYSGYTLVQIEPALMNIQGYLRTYDLQGTSAYRKYSSRSAMHISSFVANRIREPTG
ncbi:hypothetical protein BGX27_004397 [Mortierella sp. AM989]|nr:hypothetical protein BGX27_004397 [Mortierella sp. AM989]